LANNAFRPPTLRAARDGARDPLHRTGPADRRFDRPAHRLEEVVDEAKRAVELDRDERQPLEPSGDVADPVFISAANLARVPELHFELVLSWIRGERERLRLRAEAAKEAARTHAEGMRPKLEEAARGRREWVNRNWSPE
jgi:hypothetical protein